MRRPAADRHRQAKRVMIENAEPCREGQKQSDEVDGIHAFTAGCSCPLRQEKPAMDRSLR